MCDKYICEEAFNLFGTHGLCPNASLTDSGEWILESSQCICQSGFSGNDYWVIQNDCHVNDSVIAWIHITATFIYSVGTMNAMLGFQLSFAAE